MVLVTRLPLWNLLKFVSGGTLLVLGGWTIFHRVRKIRGNYLETRKKEELLSMYVTKSLENPDVVFVHVFPPSPRVPNPSGFGLKLQTFLRLTNIQYEMDTCMPKGENGKSPWVTLNGKHFSDSQLIINMLEKKVERQLYTKEQRALSTSVRIVMEEHFYWGLILWRYVFSNGSYLHQLFHFRGTELDNFRSACRKKYTDFTWGQGLGRHSQENVRSLLVTDLQMVSTLLGEKPYLCGEYPCSDDCAVFAMLAQALWADLEAPFAQIINEEFPNLADYCVRVKESLWPDWEAAKTGGLVET